jgi:asparagine synthase (glutamine-hydrolysing)
MHFDASRYLPGDLLTKVDRASMAVSLEAREPFLDHEMARVAAALPMHWKIRDGQNKYILRRLLDRHFERGLFDRPKQGFSAPIAQWLRGPLRDVVRQELSPANVRRSGLLDAEGVNSLVGGFLDGRPGASAAGVWFLLQLQQWAGRWLQSSPPVDVRDTLARSSAG